MSYSFSAKGNTKAAAMADATVKFDEMMVLQPAHQRDRAAALANLAAHLKLVAEPTEQEAVTVSMHGSICAWPTADHISSAGSGCSVSVGARAPA